MSVQFPHFSINAAGPASLNLCPTPVENYKIALRTFQGNPNNYVVKTQLVVAEQNLFDYLNSEAGRLEVQLADATAARAEIQRHAESNPFLSELRAWWGSALPSAEAPAELSSNQLRPMMHDAARVLDQSAQIHQLAPSNAPSSELKTAAESYNSLFNQVLDLQNEPSADSNLLKDLLFQLSQRQVELEKFFSIFQLQQLAALHKNPEPLAALWMRHWEHALDVAGSDAGIAEVTEAYQYYAEHAKPVDVPAEAATTLQKLCVQEEPWDELDPNMKKLFQARFACTSAAPLNPIRPPELEELLDNIYLVHVTSHLPVVEKGVLRPTNTYTLKPLPGFSWLFEEENQHFQERKAAPDSQRFRLTLHWSLQGVVPPHSGHGGEEENYTYSWEESPIAIIAPLRALLPQLVNISAGDTCTLGDVLLDEIDCKILVSPTLDLEQVHENLKDKIEACTRPTMRESVEAYITSKGASPWEKIAGHSSSAWSHGFEMHDPKLFKALLEKMPHVSFGGDIFSSQGKAYLLGSCVQLCLAFIKGITTPLTLVTENGLANFSIALIVLRHYLEESELYFEEIKPHFSKDLQDQLDMLTLKYNGWLALFERFMAECHARKAMHYVPPEQLSACFSANDPEQVVQHMTCGASGFDVQAVEDVRSATAASPSKAEHHYFDTHDLPPEQFKALMKKLSSSEYGPLMDERNFQIIELRYCICRMLHMQMPYESQLDEMLAKVVNDLKGEDCTALAQLLWDQDFVGHLTTSSSRLDAALKILSCEAFRPFVRRYYGIEKFPLKTLKALCEAHPLTQKAFSDEYAKRRDRYEQAFHHFNEESLAGVQQELNKRSEMLALQSFKRAVMYAQTITERG